MMTKSALIALVLGVTLTAGVSFAGDSDDRKALLAALPASTISLQQGIAASAATGTPTSAKFEVEDGHLQLSVYTTKAGAYSEVVVDHVTGKIGKIEAITSGEDLTAAQSQARAIGKAKASLSVAVDKAEQETTGFHAVSATAELRKGHRTAVVLLQNGKQLKSVSVSLE